MQVCVHVWQSQVEIEPIPLCSQMLYHVESVELPWRVGLIHAVLMGGADMCSVDGQGSYMQC